MMHRRIIMGREAHRRLMQSSLSSSSRQLVTGGGGVLRPAGPAGADGPDGKRRRKSTVVELDDHQRGNNEGGGGSNGREGILRRRPLPVVRRTKIVPHHPLSPTRLIRPDHRRPEEWYPPYAATGIVMPPRTNFVEIPDPSTIDALRHSGRIARQVLEIACRAAQVGITTDEIDAIVHDTLINEYNAYPSPLNYMGFPKSVCASVNEVICHGIPDRRPLAYGDIVSFDVSCYTNGVHGDNCGTVIVGDVQDEDDDEDEKDNNREDNDSTTTKKTNWLGQRMRTEFATDECRNHFRTARSLVTATLECLEAGIATVRHGSCLSDIGNACQAVADSYGFESVAPYRGHGIGHQFHIPPYVSHVRNDVQLTLQTDMVFTIEPMLCQHSADCIEWAEDGWTVATRDGGLAAQFEHMVRVTETGAEILTTSEQ
jgi:methionyl aminopeptidase